MRKWQYFTGLILLFCNLSMADEILSAASFIDIKDISPNYELYNEAGYFADNNLIPTYVDNTFQRKMPMNLLQVILVTMLYKNITPNYVNESPALNNIPSRMKIFPYVQYAAEKQLIKGGDENYRLPIAINKVIPVIKKMLPDLTFTELENSTEPFTRETYLKMIRREPQLKQRISVYQQDMSRRKKNYIGSAVNDFILGNAKALEKIELSTYRLRSRNYADMYWEVATSQDIEYDRFNEDLSNEDMDILTKRINQAILSFAEGKFWVVVEQCNIVLKEDPRNINALTLKGSAYFMLQDWEKARKYWEKVLYYQPENEEVSYFLKILKYY